MPHLVVGSSRSPFATLHFSEKVVGSPECHKFLDPTIPQPDHVVTHAFQTGHVEGHSCRRDIPCLSTLEAPVRASGRNAHDQRRRPGIDTVEETTLARITPADANAAGHESIAELKTALGKKASGSLFRITFRVAGEDPRKALRTKSRVTASEMEDIRAQLDRWDRASRSGPWRKQYLALIDRHAGLRAPELAGGVGIVTANFKANAQAEVDWTHNQPGGRLPAVAARGNRIP